MATVFTVTLTNTTADYGATRKSERAAIDYLLARCAQEVGKGTVNTGSVLDLNGNSAGTWTYTPVASS